jgi:hypothetical protein
MHNEKDGEAYQPNNGNRHAKLLPTAHNVLLITDKHATSAVTIIAPATITNPIARP